MQMPSNSFLGHPALQSNYQSMMIGAESQRLLPSWNYPPPPPPPPPPTHPTPGGAGSTSAFNCLTPLDRPSSNEEKSIQGHSQHQQLASSSSSSSIPFTAGHLGHYCCSSRLHLHAVSTLKCIYLCEKFILLHLPSAYYDSGYCHWTSFLFVCFIGGATPKFLGGPNPSFQPLCPFLPFIFSSFPFPSSLLPLPPLRGRPLKYTSGVWGARISSPSE